ncbi:MAG: hypothetical protein JSS89_12065 [Bacteroidetes bacterium]|nr:hypothetical protein [Bacteroidota bacterium]
MAARRYLRSVDFYDEMEDLGLLCDEKYLYAYLSLNRHMSVSGIYEIQRRVIMVDTGISRDRIDACLQRLVALDLIRYDAGLMFVPRIHTEQSLQTRKGWQSMLRRLRRIHKDHRSDLPGAENQAYTAFLATLAEYYYEIDSADEMDIAEAAESGEDPPESVATEAGGSGPPRASPPSPDESFERAVEEAKRTRQATIPDTETGRNREPEEDETEGIDSDQPFRNDQKRSENGGESPPIGGSSEGEHPPAPRDHPPDVSIGDGEEAENSHEIFEKSWEN